MLEKIKIEVFGIKDQAAGGGCSCGGGCGPTKTMGEEYDEFANFMSNRNFKQPVEIKFIDMLMDNLDEYAYVVEAMKEYSMPLTSINGKLTFYGGMPNENIINKIKKMA